MSDAKYRTELSAGVADQDPIINPLSKGLGSVRHALRGKNIADLGWNILREDVSLPAAILYEDKLQHNLQWMKAFASAYGVKLAPHGKTTMAPRLFRRQLEAGAWGITLATTTQVRVAYEHGVRRALLANELVGRQNVRIVAALLEDPDFDFFCLVDSVDIVEHLLKTLPANGRKLNVLVELGVDGGRTGVRDDAGLEAVLAALEKHKSRIALCGVEVYEGVLADEDAIRKFLQRAVDVMARLVAEGRFDRSPAILSGAGSAWYDVVAEVFSAGKFDHAVEIVLRPGCYLTHDVGVYREAQERIKQRNPVAKQLESSLTPALQLWAYVQSVPERDKAILGLGKRDAAFDAGLPKPALHYRSGERKPTAPPSEWGLIKMMDQHSFMQIPPGADVRVGDMIGLDISHPCLTFDKWKYLAVVDSDYHVIDIVETFF
jgi:D-serine deaminase-like pyridoxal phosphate-dependent protein